MEIRPIRIEADYREALGEVQPLWEAEPGTPEGDQAETAPTLLMVHALSNLLQIPADVLVQPYETQSPA